MRKDNTFFFYKDWDLYGKLRNRDLIIRVVELVQLDKIKVLCWILMLYTYCTVKKMIKSHDI